MTQEQLKEIRFKRSFRGYNPREVDESLDALADYIGELQRELAAAKEEVAKLARENEENKAKLTLLEEENERHRRLEQENMGRIEEFKANFVSLYHKQVKLLKTLPFEACEEAQMRELPCVDTVEVSE